VADSESSVEASVAAVPIAPRVFSTAVVPSAVEISKMSFSQCRKLLNDAGVRTRETGFDTPFVEMPLLLDGPIEGVRIAPRWPGKGEVRGDVMDCRLIVTFIALAREAAIRGATEILFYSTYRPLKRPDDACPAGKEGKVCRSRLDAWKKAEAGKLSQHHRATAIDIHGFTMSDGRYVTVLDSYERKDGQPPCADKPATADGVFLQSLACALHEQRVFNVMLTPNANKAHHNHFHFDITLKATWYIIR